MNKALIERADGILEFIGMTETEKTEHSTLGSNTKVRLGLVVALIFMLFALVGTITAASWWAGNWAASMTGKMDLVIKNQESINTEFNRLNSDVLGVKSQLLGMSQSMKLMDGLGTKRLQEANAQLQAQIVAINTRLSEVEKGLLRFHASGQNGQ